MDALCIWLRGQRLGTASQCYCTSDILLPGISSRPCTTCLDPRRRCVATHIKNTALRLVPVVGSREYAVGVNECQGWRKIQSGGCTRLSIILLWFTERRRETRHGPTMCTSLLYGLLPIRRCLDVDIETLEAAYPLTTEPPMPPRLPSTPAFFRFLI